jgi:hypothetical protein
MNKCSSTIKDYRTMGTVIISKKVVQSTMQMKYETVLAIRWVFQKDMYEWFRVATKLR